jgi:hypothetical protein
MVNLASELTVWIGLFLFGLFFEGWIITHPQPAGRAWLEPLVRMIAAGLGITVLGRSYHGLSVEDIVRHIWLPLLFAVGPAVAFQIIKHSQDSFMAREEADKFQKKLDKLDL